MPHHHEGLVSPTATFAGFHDLLQPNKVAARLSVRVLLTSTRLMELVRPERLM
jgi:hypothetical protein